MRRIFPPESYFNFRGYPPIVGHMYSDRFIGCWKKEDAWIVARLLREWGFQFKMRGRGPRIHDNHVYRDSLPIKLATHISFYLRNTEAIEIPVIEALGIIPDPNGRVKSMIETI